MSNMPVQIQLPRRRKNITLKLGRMYALGYDEIDRFETLLNKNINFENRYSYTELLEIITANLQYIKTAEIIIDNIELEHGIITGDGLFEKSILCENKLAWVIDYPIDQLINWINNKMAETSKLCGGNNILVTNRIKVLMTEDAALRKIKDLDYMLELNMNKLSDYQYKKTLIGVLIKLTVGYPIRCTGILV